MTTLSHPSLIKSQNKRRRLQSSIIRRQRPLLCKRISLSILTLQMLLVTPVIKLVMALIHPSTLTKRNPKLLKLKSNQLLKLIRSKTPKLLKNRKKKNQSK
jgi:hypothetical protein